MKAPRVLVLDEEIPFPPNTGKRIRTLNLLQRLAATFDIEMVVNESADARHAAEMRDRGIGITFASASPPPKRGAGLVASLVRSTLSADPHSARSHRTRAFREVVRAILSERKPALLHAEWTPYAQYWSHGDPPLVVAAHNVEFEVLRRLAANQASPVYRMFFGDQARRMESFERRIFASVRHATAVTARDASQLGAWGCSDVEVVPNGVDTGYFRPRPDITPRARSLVFTGSMDWRPNQDAIAWFAREIHPFLLQQGPYRLTVVGRNPPPGFRERHGVPDEIVLTGTVDDVRPYIAESSIFVTPLRVGGGSRLKIIEALAMQRPVVSTAIGAEGLDLTPGREICIASNPAEFASAIDLLLSDTATANRLAENGRRAVLDQYDWDSIFQRQAALWERAIG